MKKLIYAFIASLVLVACAPAAQQPAQQDQAPAQQQDATEVQEEQQENLRIVTTFSILEDMIRQVAGDIADIYTIVPIGDDPHEHEVLPEDLLAVYNSDIILYHGLNLETGYYGWFANLLNAADRELLSFAVTDGIQPVYLLTEGLEDYHDPHAWLDISNGIIYIQNITRILSDFSPQHAPVFEANAEAYIDRLYALHNEWLGAFDEIPYEQRLLITAEGAFRYFGYAYNVRTAHIWEINAHEEGTPEQMLALISTINDSDVVSLFSESSIDPQYINQISQETGIPVFAMLYTDSLSEPTGEAATYYDMMLFNLSTIYAGLTAN